MPNYSFPPGNLFVTVSQLENILDATSYMNATFGVGFDTHVVITHGLCGVSDHDDASRRVWSLFHRLQKWKRRRKAEAFYVFVHENSPERGLHTHILLHSGDDWPALKVWLPEAIGCLWGAPLPPAALCIKRRRQAELAHRVLLQWIWIRYLLKGIWPGLLLRSNDGQLRPVHEILGLRPRNGGLVLCRKRAGVSSNIGRKARKEAGYVSPLQKGDDASLYSGDEFQVYAEKVWEKKAANELRELHFSLL